MQFVFRAWTAVTRTLEVRPLSVDNIIVPVARRLQERKKDK